MRRTAPALAAMLSLGLLAAAPVADAQNYRRPVNAAVPQAPAYPPGDPRTPAPGFALNGFEAPAYGYGYVLNMPADGNWRWIDDRCYQAGSGRQTCVQGHWVRRAPGQCEEVSAHTVRTGSYVRLVPAGQVASCR
jgi:hypothetical protein